MQSSIRQTFTVTVEDRQVVAELVSPPDGQLAEEPLDWCIELIPLVVNRDGNCRYLRHGIETRRSGGL